MKLTPKSSQTPQDQQISNIELQLKKMTQNMDMIMQQNHTMIMQFHQQNLKASYHSKWTPNQRHEAEGNNTKAESGAANGNGKNQEQPLDHDSKYKQVK